jgi:hypothetical protein
MSVKKRNFFFLIRVRFVSQTTDNKYLILLGKDREEREKNNFFIKKKKIIRSTQLTIMRPFSSSGESKFRDMLRFFPSFKFSFFQVARR